MVDQIKSMIELTEYATKDIPKNNILNEIGETIWKHYDNQIEVEFPTLKTNYHWQLTSKGWVGFIPITPDFGLNLLPKVELSNLFHMLEYAYKLDFIRKDGLIDCHSLEDFYERLATILARRILDRERKGLYREYIAETDRLPYLCGRLNVRKAIQTPWEVKLQCHYEEHTPDITENQILAWTLSRIAKSGMCTERSLPTVRRAYRGLQGFISLIPFYPKECIGRLYNRLNDDYQSLHGLCRFFLEHSGPSHELGDRKMLPFLVDMWRLFEQFVAEWLKKNLPEQLELKVQERVDIDQTNSLHFVIDLVLRDKITGKSLIVLDTKYKIPNNPRADLPQVVAYAEVMDCKEGVLIYPKQMKNPLDIMLGNIHVRSLAFSLDGELEESGKTFISEMITVLKSENIL